MYSTTCNERSENAITDILVLQSSVTLKQFVRETLTI